METKLAQDFKQDFYDEYKGYPPQSVFHSKVIACYFHKKNSIYFLNLTEEFVGIEMPISLYPETTIRDIFSLALAIITHESIHKAFWDMGIGEKTGDILDYFD